MGTTAKKKRKRKNKMPQAIIGRVTPMQTAPNEQQFTLCHVTIRIRLDCIDAHSHKSGNSSFVNMPEPEGTAGFEKSIRELVEYMLQRDEREAAEEIFQFFQERHRNMPSKKTATKKPIEFKKEELEQVIMKKADRQSVIEALSQEQEDYRKTLFIDWGFGTSFEKGKGVIMLFYGIPGTGKTMLAEKIAKYLHKDHMMLGNAELQSQVPGQMERNIKEAFEKAKKSKLVIIFDECDTLLTNRGKVGAILAGEINCLLSEIERFDGVCIMTTNRNNQLDPALERRIALKLEFKAPDKKMRHEIWKALIPEKCPTDKDVCLETLSKFSIQGGHIKNCIFTAARKAVFAGRKKVRMKDFEHAVDIEMKGMKAFKVGKQLSPDELMRDDMDVVQGLDKRSGMGRFLQNG